METLIPVATFVLGYVAKLLTDLVQHRWTVEREREGRREQRRDQLAGRRAETQRATLIELQEVMASLGRATGKANHEDVMAHRATGRWQKQKLSEEANQGIFVCQQRSLVLAARVADEQVRALTVEMKDRCSTVARATDPNTAETSMLAMNATFEALNERIGHVLRSLDEEQVD